MGLRIPKKRAEAPNAGRGEFPEGLWLLTLEEVYSNTVERTAKMAWAFEANANGNVAYRGADAEELRLQWGSAQALNDGQEEAGNQKLFTRITVRDGATDIDKVDTENAEGVGYKILTSTGIFVNLALALGQAYEEDGYVQPSDDFLAQLRSGAYKGMEVVAKVKHRHYTKKDGTAGMEVEVEAFSPAA